MLIKILFLHCFFIAFFIISYIVIIYYNYNAMKTFLENKIVNVYQEQGNCLYDNLDLIPDKDRCSKLNRYFKTIDGLIYTLSTDDSNPSTVCKVLCSTYNENSISPCQGTKYQNTQYNNCINNLKPSSNCKGLARPIGYRINNNNKSNNRVYMYAKAVFTSTKDCN